MRVENDLGKDRVSRLVWRIAIPSMLAQFVSVCYSIVDRIFVGNIPEVGDISLAGVGICGPIVTMIGAVAYLVGMGGTPLMGISLGERNKHRAEQIMSNCFLLLCIAAVLLTTIVLPLREPMLRLFGASDATYPYAEKYFVIYISGTIFALIASGMNQFVICQGYAKVGMLSVMIGAVMNVVLDPVCIYVLDMGVSGAALATIVSQAVSAGFVLRFLLSDRAEVRLSFGAMDPDVVKRVMKLGFAPFAIIALDNVMIIAMNALLQKYGGAEGDTLITCNTIVQSFMLVMTMPLGGISGGTQSILSYNYGACRSDRVLKAQKYIMALCAAYTGVMFLLARLAGPLFASLFTSDAEMNALACWAIRVCTLGAVPLGIQYAIIDGFTGMGQVQLSLPLSLWRKLVYFVSIFVLPVLFNAETVFYAEAISDLIGPAVSVLVYCLSIRRILRRREMG